MIMQDMKDTKKLIGTETKVLNANEIENCFKLFKNLSIQN